MGQWADMPMSQLKNEKSTKLNNNQIKAPANRHISRLADWHIITGGLAQLARASALHADWHII